MASHIGDWYEVIESGGSSGVWGQRPQYQINADRRQIKRANVKIPVELVWEPVRGYFWVYGVARAFFDKSFINL